MLQPSERRLAFIVPGHLVMYGLCMWMAGSFEGFLFGWLSDPAVAKVGRATVVLATPVFLLGIVRCVVNGDFADWERKREHRQ